MAPDHLTNYLINRVSGMIDDIADDMDFPVTLDGRTTTSDTTCTQTATIDGHKVRITVEVDA